MKFPCSHGLVAGLLGTAILAPASGAAAQSLGDAQLAFRANISPVVQPTSSLSLQEYGGTPRWVKWGLIGAAAGAATFALLSGTSTDADRSATKDAAAGAVFGFVVLGGGVAFYDWVCKPDSASERAGLC